MFDKWKLGEYMNAAYKVMCEWYPGEKEYNKKEILNQMQNLTPDTTFYQATFELLVNRGEWGKFNHHAKCEHTDLDELGDCVACHIVKAFEENVVNQKVIMPKGYHDVEEFYPENEDE